MTPFKLTDELLAQIEELILNHSDSRLLALMEEIHYADVAEIANELSEEQATYLIKLLDSDKTSDVLTELDDDVREAILNNLSSKEIAEEFNIPLEDKVVAEILSDRSLKSDMVHPNAKGYRKMADAVFALLKKSKAI